MTWLYEKHRREQGEEAARSLTRSILEQNKGNVSKTSFILWCARKTVRRSRDGPLKDISRAPHTSHISQTPNNLEWLILQERETTKYGRVRLAKHIFLKYGLSFPSSTIGKILKRNKVQKYNYSRKKWIPKPLYDYENILPFEYGQVDTKHIEDFEALGELCFIPRKYNLPLYQWSYICVKTKYKFIAYSHSLCSDFGLMFLLFISTHLRSMGIRCHIQFQWDNGPADFCGGSKKKEEDWNGVLKHLNASFVSIPAGKKYLQWVVERSHRTDDEELYRPYLERMKSLPNFLYHAEKYIHTYNTYRPSFWIGMEGKSPVEKLRECHILHPTKFSTLPVLILENLAQIGGTYLKDHYHLDNFLDNFQSASNISPLFKVLQLFLFFQAYIKYKISQFSFLQISCASSQICISFSSTDCA